MTRQTADPQHALHGVLASLCQRRRVPVSTYRLQFQPAFGFREAARLVPYLSTLGITDCYASPWFQASPGSTHGYDISDHTVLNPELGTDADFTAFTDALKAHQIGLVLDVVPNHMGIATRANRWWWDVLENGPTSPYAAYFDIDWAPDCCIADVLTLLDGHDTKATFFVTHPCDVLNDIEAACHRLGIHTNF